MKHLFNVLLALLFITTSQQMATLAQQSGSTKSPNPDAAPTERSRVQRSKKKPVSASSSSLESDNHSLNGKDLKLEIEAGKKEFLPLEPILITIKLSSISGQPIVARDGEKGIKVISNLTIWKKKKNESLTIDSGSLQNTLEDAAPGESALKFKFLITDGLQDFMLKPDHYWITLNLDLGKKVVLKAQDLDITVVEPNGLDREAFDFIRSVGSLKNFMQGSGSAESADADSSLRGFVTHFRDSGYGDYFAFQLAANCFQKGELSGAKGLLQELAIKSDFGYAEDVVGMMALISAQLGQRNLLEGYLQRLRSEFPQSSYIPKLTEMLNGEK